MLVALIAAMDHRGLIGAEGGLPWHLPLDLRRFRAGTWGKPLIMGRRTFASIGKALPGRCNIILTRDPDYDVPGCRVARSFQEALSLAEDYLARAGGEETMIIGGSKVYAQAIHWWDRLYLTVVEGQFTGNAYFPLRQLLRQRWRPVRAPETHPADEKNRSSHSYHVLERIWETGRGSPRHEEDDLGPASSDKEQALEGLDLAALLARGNSAR